MRQIGVVEPDRRLVSDDLVDRKRVEHARCGVWPEEVGATRDRVRQATFGRRRRELREQARAHRALLAAGPNGCAFSHRALDPAVGVDIVEEDQMRAMRDRRVDRGTHDDWPLPSPLARGVGDPGGQIGDVGAVKCRGHGGGLEQIGDDRSHARQCRGSSTDRRDDLAALVERSRGLSADDAVAAENHVVAGGGHDASRFCSVGKMWCVAFSCAMRRSPEKSGSPRMLPTTMSSVIASGSESVVSAVRSAAATTDAAVA